MSDDGSIDDSELSRVIAGLAAHRTGGRNRAAHAAARNRLNTLHTVDYAVGSQSNPQRGLHEHVQLQALIQQQLRIQRQLHPTQQQPRSAEQIAELQALLTQVENTISTASPGPSFLPPEGFLPHETAFDMGSVEPRARNKSKKKETKEPVTTIVSALPKTSYREQDESKSGEKTLAYIQVQRSLLNWLATNAADTLTPFQARKWTEAIEPKSLAPKPQDALRLCYYMRSQSFDNYAKLSDGYISLYVVKQSSHIRGPEHDRLYWKQSYKTNYVEYMAPSHEVRNSRRNAMVDIYNHFSIGGDIPDPSSVLHPRSSDTLLNLLGFGLNEAANPAFEASVEQLLAAPPAASANADAGADAHVEDLSVLRETTERNLSRLLMEENQDSNAILAALAQIEELDQQLD